MKKIIIFITSLLLLTNTLACANIVVADDEQLDEATIAILKEIYEDDQKTVDKIISDIELNENDLENAKDNLTKAQAKQTAISQTYNPLLEKRNKALEELETKEETFKELEDKITSTDLEEANKKLEELKMAEEKAANALFEASTTDIDTLKLEYENAQSYVTKCENNLTQAKADYDAAEDWLKDFLYKDAVDLWTSNLESAKADLEIKKAAYESANKDTSNINELSDAWKNANEELEAQQEIVDNLEAELKKNNEEYLKVQEELYAMQLDFYMNIEDGFIKAKVEYDDINEEVYCAQILVDSLKDQINALTELLDEANKDLAASKSAYETAINKIREDKGSKESTDKGIIVEKVETKVKQVEELKPAVKKVNASVVSLNDKETKAKEENKEIIPTLVIEEPNKQEEIATVKEVLNDNSSYNHISTMDISLQMKIDGDDNYSRTVSNTDEELSIQFTIPSEYINLDESITRTYKVIRIHEGNTGIETKVLDGEFDSSTNVFTFKTDKFSTYALVYEDTKKGDSVSSNTTVARTCEEAIGRNWIWSTSSNSCVYKVTNTSSK